MENSITLDELIIGIEAQSETLANFFNRKTGEIVAIPEEYMTLAEMEDEEEDEMNAWEQDLMEVARGIAEGDDDFVPLPEKWELDEYSLMEEFAAAQTDDTIREAVQDAIKGSGAFGRFDEALDRYRIADAWETFRDNAVRTIAREWCEENDIDLVE